MDYLEKIEINKDILENIDININMDFLENTDIFFLSTYIYGDKISS